MNVTEQTVRIWYENLAVMVGNERRPVSALTPRSHIHGGLRLEIAGRLVPHLGFWGPDDVCFSDWLGELWRAAKALRHPGGRYVFDEGEQGQPAFLFERVGDNGLFGIVTSERGDGVADPDWQQVQFRSDDFVNAHESFRNAFFADIRQSAPEVAEEWIDRLMARIELDS